MSRFREYEDLKVEKASLYAKLWVYGLGVLGLSFVPLFFVDVFPEDMKQFGFALICAPSVIFGIPLWRMQMKHDKIEARVKAMEHSNFKESYIQQDIGIKSGSVQGYSKNSPPSKLDSFESEIKKLNEMKSKGLIDEEEYKKLRAKLLE